MSRVYPKKMMTTNVSFPKMLHQEMVDIARRRQQSMAEFIRYAVSKEIDELTKPKEDNTVEVRDLDKEKKGVFQRIFKK